MSERVVSEALCHHCGALPDVDGDHTCPCPNTDAECREHPRPYVWCDRCKRRHYPGERCGRLLSERRTSG